MKIKKSPQKNTIQFNFTERSHENKLKNLDAAKDSLNSFYNRKKKISYVNITVKSGWSKSAVNKFSDIGIKAKDEFLHSFFVSDKAFLKNPNILMENIIEDLQDQRKRVLKKGKKYKKTYNDKAIQIEFGYKKPKQIKEYKTIKLKRVRKKKSTNKPKKATIKKAVIKFHSTFKKIGKPKNK